MALPFKEEQVARSAVAEPHPGRSWLEAPLISLSIANLCFLFLWMQVLAISGDSWFRFIANYSPNYSLLWALTFDIVCLSTLLWVCMAIAKTHRPVQSNIAKTILVLSCGVALYMPFGIFAATLLGHRLRFRLFSYFELALAILLLVFLAFRLKLTVRTLQVLFLIVSPICPLLLLNGLRQTHSERAKFKGNGAAAGMLPSQKNKERVIWIIFDELDERLLFDARPQRIRLPEFDRFRAESLDGAKVKSPAMNTTLAVPSLLLGKGVACFGVSSKRQLLVKFDPSPAPVPYTSEKDIFKKVRAAGFNAGVSGWLFPYCRLVGSHVSDCGWGLCGFEVPSIYLSLIKKPFLDQASYLARWQAEVLPFITRPITPKPDQESIERVANIETLQVVLENALRMLRNPDMNLVFIHLPIPHPPGIWDAKRSALTSGESDYVDNLALADKVLGRFRETLEKVGDWDRSTVLVSSDHPFRAATWTGPQSPYTSREMEVVSRRQWFPYIPFLLKLPFQNQHVSYKDGFNSVLTSELVLNILNKQLRTPYDVTRWLDINRIPLSGNTDNENNAEVCE